MHTPDEALKQFPLVKLKCELVSTDGRHVRYVPGPLAQAMVDSSAAAIHNENGKVKAIRLTQPPSSYAQ